MINYGPLRGDGTDAGDVSGKNMVITVVPIPDRSEVGGINSRRRDGRVRYGEIGGALAGN